MSNVPNIVELVKAVTDASGKMISSSGRVIGAIAKKVTMPKKSRKPISRTYVQPRRAKTAFQEGARVTTGTRQKKR